MLEKLKNSPWESSYELEINLISLYTYSFGESLAWLRDVDIMLISYYSDIQMYSFSEWLRGIHNCDTTASRFPQSLSP